MKQIDLYKHNLTELTESDLTALCHLNNIKPEQLTVLNLYNNKLENINFITENTPFINLEDLYLYDNQITDINNIKYLKNLEVLDLSRNKLNDLNFITRNNTNLKKLYISFNNIKNLDNIEYLTELEVLDIRNLKLNNKYETIRLLKTLKKLELLIVYNNFNNYTDEQLEKELPKVKIY